MDELAIPSDHRVDQIRERLAASELEFSSGMESALRSCMRADEQSPGAFDAALDLALGLADAGIDPARALSDGVPAVVEARGGSSESMADWLAPVGDYVRTLHAADVELWTAVSYGLRFLTTVSGSSLSDFRRSLERFAELLVTLKGQGVDSSRLVTHGTGALREVLGDQPWALDPLCVLAERVGRTGGEPGWIWQICGHDWAQALIPVEEAGPPAYERALDRLGAFLEAAPEAGMSAGSRLADGVVTFSRYGAGMLERLDEWFDLTLALIRSMTSQGMSPYLPIGEGFGGIVGHVQPAELSDVLKFAVRLADRGIDPGGVLYEAFMPSAIAFGTEATIEIAHLLAEQGFDPFDVIRHAVPHVGQAAGMWPEEERMDRSNECLVHLVDTALALHAADLKGWKYFTHAVPGLAERIGANADDLIAALGMGARLAESGVAPGMALARGWHYVLDGSEDHPWLIEEGRSAVELLGGKGLDPDTTLTYAFPILLRVTGGDRADFISLKDALLEVVVALEAAGVSAKDVLHYDVSAMAEARDGEGADAFRALLVELRALLSGMAKSGVSPERFLRAGLPAAARVAHEEKWRLDASFAAMHRWSAQGRDGAPVIEHAVAAVAGVDGADRARFDALLDAVERAAQRIGEPACEWALSPLAESAAALAGEDAGAFEGALSSALERLDFSVEDDAVARALASALPLLGSMAGGSPESLGTLLDAASAHAKGMAAADRPMGDLLWYGLRAIAPAVQGDAREARETLDLLAEWIMKEPRALGSAVVRPPDTRGYGRFRSSALEVLVRVSAGDAEGVRRGVPMLFRAADLFSVDGSVEKESVRQLVEFAAAIPPSTEKSFAENLDWFRAQLSGDALASLARGIVAALDGCLSLVGRFSSSWSSLIRPTMTLHGVQSIGVLRSFRWLEDRWIQKESDLNVLADIVTQCGVRVPEILDGLILRGLREGAIRDLTAERELILRFIREVPLADSQFYWAFRSIYSDAGTSEAQKRELVNALQESLRGLSDAVRSGEVTDEEVRDPLFPLVLYYVFPPSTTTSRDAHAMLFSRFSDHADHLAARDPGALSRREYSLRQGSWALLPGVEVDRSPWDLLMQVREEMPPVDAVQGDLADTVAAFGWELLGRWAEGRIGRDGPKRQLLASVLVQARTAGVELPRQADSPAQLIECKEFLGDHVRDVVERSLIAARADDAKRYDRLVHDKIAPDTSIGTGLVKSMWRLAQDLRSPDLGGRGLPADEAAARIERQLRPFHVDPAEMVGRLRACQDRDEVRTLLHGLAPIEVEIEPGKEQSRLMADFVGRELTTMHQELFGGNGRPAKLVYELSSDAEPLRIVCEMTKRRAHAPIGLCEGVCVAVDQRLWDTPTFFQVVFWGQDGIAAGGMHVLFVREGDDEYLSLPGINPTLRLLDTVEASAVLDLAVDYAWRLARHFGCRGVWVPTSGAIFSNRRGIHVEVARRDWPTRDTAQHAFSFSPYAYSFRQVFEVPEPDGE